MKGLTSIIFIIISVVIFFMFINPVYNEVQALQVEIAENEETLKLAETLSSKRKELKDRYNIISDTDRKQLEKVLPDTVDNVRLLIDITSIASGDPNDPNDNGYGITLTGFNITSTEEQQKEVRVAKSEFEGIIEDSELEYVDTSKVGVISLSFSVNTQYDVFNQFLKELEESMRIVDVRSISISRSGNEEVFYNYGVNLDTYWLK